MRFNEYITHLLTIRKISDYPIGEFNENVGLLRLQDIQLYEPYIMNFMEKLFKLQIDKTNSKKGNLRKKEKEVKY